MIENKKVEIVEEDSDKEEQNKTFLKTGAIICGSILFLMIACIIVIVILENI